MIRVEFEMADINEGEARTIVQLLSTKFAIHQEVFGKSPLLEAVKATKGEQTTSQVLGPAKDPVAPLTPEQSKAVAQNVAAEGGKARRPGRPTKEESAAKKAQEAAAKNPVPTEAPNGVAGAVAPAPEPQNPPAVAGEPRKYSVDELRVALQDFTVATTLKQGKELLSSYGCSRITDMADKDAAVQSEFMQKCRA